MHFLACMGEKRKSRIPERDLVKNSKSNPRLPLGCRLHFRNTHGNHYRARKTITLYVIAYTGPRCYCITV